MKKLKLLCMLVACFFCYGLSFGQVTTTQNKVKTALKKQHKKDGQKTKKNLKNTLRQPASASLKSYKKKEPYRLFHEPKMIKDTNK